MSYPPDPAAPEPGPAYPEPPYPGTPAPPSYPGAAPQYPGGAATPPPYPGASATPPPYPGAAAPPPPYPGTPAPPSYPGAAPQYPGAGAAPSYPAAPPAHPGAAPTYPSGPQPPTATAPPYIPPQTPPMHTPSAAAPPTPPAPPEATAPDDLDYRHAGSRVHVAAHQRGADATAIGQLAVQVPGFLVSLAVVASFAVGILGTAMGWLVILAWLASGALVFHRPTELAFARHMMKLRVPLAEERARLEPIWREVTARAGIEAHTYELMVENSTDLNAVAAAGHVVGVTTYALNEIPSSNLAAVLAHELGHHTGGHAWTGLLGYWYSLPGRIAWAFMRGIARIAIRVASVFSLAATGMVYLFIGMFVIGGFVAAWYITVPLVIAPYLLAYVGRQGELRADRQAADLGFAPQLAQVLYHFQAQEDAVKAQAAAQGRKLKEPGGLARLLTTHPDNYTRLQALEPYLQLSR
ncbi:M48 family metalloprotease [Streptomyces sp. NBC_01728]|uniref:M48 family metalloprotease n=1 Tax=unclassified Streptomyces TaxID=2593676 RepID=UPI0022558BF8|nr:MULTISPECIES: M48 family metalloprotease [unclassified Streptomyces]MCX4456103.1 M48 family metalloprotease [Streptomyces sp. NBC_01719]MCX4495462.1 M48 family metalloprotease [Streptomyces sp. NBC_01728]MCX4589955.1 M48 family metalloprotease [Streptomyces sp. NBC_01549]